MTTMCYSHESAPGASPARGLDETAKFLTSLDSPRTNLSPDEFSPPQPRFVFPAAPPSPDLSPPSYSARRRRPLSAVETHTTSFSLAVASTERMTRHAALPDFSFNPGAALPPSPNVQLFLSPPEPFSASRPISISARPGGHGHRRGGSEFVGGRLREGSSIAVLNASSTKPETAPPLPSLQLPPPGRRGHRRGVSGTISTNDLPLIAPPLLQASFQKESSAPSSPPSSGPEKPCPPLGLDDSPALMQSPEPVQPLEHIQVVQKSDSDTAQMLVAVDAAEKTQHFPKPFVRARVGFSETLEFIPRPSSLISTDTSSTLTVRPGHSVSGSISSVISGAPGGGVESPAILSRVPTGEQADHRPSTASIILDRATEFQPPNEESVSSRRRNSIPVLRGATVDDTLASAMPSSMKTPKRWSFFGFESLTGAASPSRLRSSSSSSSDSTPRATCSGSSDHESDISAEGSEDACKPKKGGKKGGKKNRVKGWAGSILPRKSKGKKPVKLSRPPTPPASISHLEDEENEDTHSVGSKQPMMASLPAVRIIEPQSPRPRRTRDESSFAMIDLDAALGPFNTPMSYNAEWEAAQHAADNSTMRRLHSAQGMRGFSGPGMHYHRRSESAPALPPFESGRAFINRFGSNSTMADVFEEDEEDEDEEVDRCTSETDESLDGESSRSPFPLLDALVVNPRDESPRFARRRSSGSADADEPLGIYPVRTESSQTLLQEAIIVEAPQGQSVSDTRALQGSRDSLESGSPSLGRFPGLHDHAMADDGPFSLSNSSGLHFGSYTMSSSHPSPRSPISVDAQRISTAPSSVTDANSFHSLLMGEPGPEVRISMDYDIPSLASSPSTMTRDSTPLPMPRANQPALREQRPVSVSAAFGRRRSSLVSLSRLISSSHGERSKLSMEVTLPSEAPHEKKLKHKGSRLSRMMQFWKPNKDGAAPEQSKVPRTTLK